MSMNIEQLIDALTDEAKDTGNAHGGKVVMFERIVSLFSKYKIAHDVHYHIMLEVEKRVNAYFRKVTMSPFN